MATYPYTPPDFLQNQTVDEIHQRMLDALPDDIDKSELQIPWDFTRPAALEKAEFVQFEMNEAIKMMFPQWASGAWLDLHVQLAGLQRRPADKASGYLTVVGVPGTTIPQGFQFATTANPASSVLFETTEDVTLGGSVEQGEIGANIPIQAVTGGTDGNVAPNTIILMATPMSGISFVTNPGATTGGGPAENDDTLRERIIQAFQHGTSFTGCDADYVRWAQEVSDVGHVIVEPEWNDPNLPAQFHWTDAAGNPRCAGAVRLIIVTEDGLPASTGKCTEVYNHIVSPDDRMARLAPIGATVTVEPPAAVTVMITADVLLQDGADLATVTENFKANLNQYWLTAAQESLIKYVYVGATLADTAGVADYKNLFLQYSIEKDGVPYSSPSRANIPIHLGYFPVTDTQAKTGGILLQQVTTGEW